MVGAALSSGAIDHAFALIRARYDATVAQMEHDIEQRVWAYARESTPALFGTERIVLAISGGGDSVAMAAILCEILPEHRSGCVVAHFDHGLRGERAALMDGAAVAALCKRYGLALRTKTWSNPRPGEAAARTARYAFLAEVARAENADAVVTGHTADDQVETIVMHVMRGSGLHGLTGMAPQSILPVHADAAVARPALIRPLLVVSRAETHAYCRARRLTYADDVTNRDPRFLRTRVRHELLPALEGSAPGVRARVLNAANAARDSIRRLDVVASPAISSRAPAGAVALSRGALRELGPDAGAHAIRLGVSRLLGDAREFDSRHYALLAAAATARTGSTFHMPRGVVATVDPDVVVFSAGRPRPASIDPSFEVALPFDGACGEWHLHVSPASERRDGATGEQVVLLPPGCVVRGRRPGDRIRPRGLQGSKKLQDYYTDRKVPRRMRDGAPIIARDRDVWWTPYGAVEPPAAGDAARYAVTTHPAP